MKFCLKGHVEFFLDGILLKPNFFKTFLDFNILKMHILHEMPLDLKGHQKVTFMSETFWRC